MKKRIILYKKGFRYELALEEGKTATVSNQETAQLTLASQENPLHFQWSQGEIFYQYCEDKGVLENSAVSPCKKRADLDLSALIWKTLP